MAEEFTHEEIVAFQEGVAAFWNNQRLLHSKSEMTSEEIYEICSEGLDLQVTQYSDRPEELPRAMELVVAHFAIITP